MVGAHCCSTGCWPNRASILRKWARLCGFPLLARRGVVVCATSEAEQLFRRMCFNVFAHNHDDHSNNFAWLCTEGKWRLAPAFDLTYSSTLFGGHTTTVNGNARPIMADLLTLAQEAGISSAAAKRIALHIQDAATEVCKKAQLQAGREQL